MTQYTFDDAKYPELFREAFGYGPSAKEWTDCSDDEKQDKWDYLQAELKHDAERASW